MHLFKVVQKNNTRGLLRTHQLSKDIIQGFSFLIIQDIKDYDFPKSGLEEHFKEERFMVANYEYKIINGEEISVDCLIKIIIGMTSEFTRFSI